MSKDTLSKYIGAGIAFALAGCQTPAPQAVAPLQAAPQAYAAGVARSAIAWDKLKPSPTLAGHTMRRVQSLIDIPGFSQGSIITNPSIMGQGAMLGGLLPLISQGAFGGGSNVFLADPIARTVYQVTALGGAVAPLALSPGGSLVAVADGGQLGILDLRSQLIQTFPQLEGTPMLSASVDAYGDVVYVDFANQVHIFNPRTGQDFISPVASRGLAGVNNISVSGDGRIISYTGLGAGGPNIYSLDMATGQQLSPPFLTGVTGDVGNLQLAANGTSVLYTQNGQLRLLDLTSGFTDNLALLNNGDPIVDAQFLDASNTQIAFTRDGALQVFDRRTGLINTLPWVNQMFSPTVFGTR